MTSQITKAVNKSAICTIGLHRALWLLAASSDHSSVTGCVSCRSQLVAYISTMRPSKWPSVWHLGAPFVSHMLAGALPPLTLWALTLSLASETPAEYYVTANDVIRRSLVDSRTRSQHEGTARSGSWRRRSALMVWRCNLGRNFWWRATWDVTVFHTFGTTPGSVRPSSLQLLGRLRDLTDPVRPTGLWKLLVPGVPVLRSSWHKSEGVWVRWRLTPEKLLFFSKP